MYTSWFWKDLNFYHVWFGPFDTFLVCFFYSCFNSKKSSVFVWTLQKYKQVGSPRKDQLGEGTYFRHTVFLHPSIIWYLSTHPVINVGPVIIPELISSCIHSGKKVLTETKIISKTFVRCVSVFIRTRAWKNWYP